VQVHYGEGVANHADPESCAAYREMCSYERRSKNRPQNAAGAVFCGGVKVTPPPDLGFMVSCLSIGIHGTPEGCSEWRSTGVFDERCSWMAEASVR
jgi:hypothetical protein